jgi:hypothetical protein
MHYMPCPSQSSWFYPMSSNNNMKLSSHVSLNLQEHNVTEVMHVLLNSQLSIALTIHHQCMVLIHWIVIQSLRNIPVLLYSSCRL